MVVLGRDLRDFYILGGYALVLLIAGFPRYRNLEEWVQGGGAATPTANFANGK